MPEKKNLLKWKKVRLKNSKLTGSEEGKKRRHAAKATKDQLQFKENAKKRHINGKVPVKESAKETKKRGPGRCSVCRQLGHNKGPCPLPPLEPEEKETKESKRVNLLDWNTDTPVAKKSRAKRHKPVLIDWSV